MGVCLTAKLGKGMSRDLSPITIESLRVNGVTLVANPPLVFEVDSLNDNSGDYCLNGEFDISLFAESRVELESALEELLELLWETFALADDRDLAKGARILKQNMLNRLKLKTTD